MCNVPTTNGVKQYCMYIFVCKCNSFKSNNNKNNHTSKNGHSSCSPLSNLKIASLPSSDTIGTSTVSVYCYSMIDTFKSGGYTTSPDSLNPPLTLFSIIVKVAFMVELIFQVIYCFKVVTTLSLEPTVKAVTFTTPFTSNSKFSMSNPLFVFLSR